MTETKRRFGVLPFLLLVIDVVLLIWIVHACRDQREMENRPQVTVQRTTAATAAPKTTAASAKPATAATQTPATAKPTIAAPTTAATAATPAATAAALRDPAAYEAADPPALSDFLWYTEDIRDGKVPANVERLSDFREVTGRWKGYIIDINQLPEGQGAYMVETFLNITVDGKADSCELTFDWLYTHLGSTGEGYEDNSPDTLFTGAWSDGGLEALGTGSVEVTAFWYQDGHEYAIGKMHWPDGTSGTLMMVRP